VARSRFGTYVSSLIPGLQEQGLTANAALATLKDLGLGIRRQTFLQEWGAQIAEGAKRESIIRANLERPPTSSEITRRQSPHASGYNYVITHIVVDPISGEPIQIPGGYTTPRLSTYGEAIQQAEFGYMLAQSFDPRCPQGALIGSYVSAVREWVPIVTEG